MPEWASVVAAAFGGLGVGLVPTLLRIAEERGAGLRRETMAAVQQIAETASDWFRAVDEAIECHEHDRFDCDGAIETATLALHEGHKCLDVLASLVGPRSPLVQICAETLGQLSEALRVLPSRVTDELEELLEQNNDQLELTDDQEIELIIATTTEWSVEGRVAAARRAQRKALERWADFTAASAANFRRGLLRRSPPSATRKARTEQ